MDRPPPLPRRRFLHLTGTALGLTATSACASSAPSGGTSARTSAAGATSDRTYTPNRFDPWIELDQCGLDPQRP